MIVYNGSNQELGRSALLVRAPSTAVVDLVTSEDQEDRGLSELQQVRSRTAAHTQGVFLGGLQSEQVDFVAQATEVARGRVEALVGAESLWMSVGAAASGDPYYPFVRMGLPTTKRGLLSYPKATLHRVLDEAREAKIVGREVSDDIVELLTQAAVDLATEAPAGTTCNLGQLLDLELGGSATQHFIAEYMAFDGIPEAFWTHLASLPEYQGEGSLLIPRLKLLLQLGALTRYHFPLIEELWDRWHDNQFENLKDLAAYSEADWIAILAVQRSGSPINTPDDTPGATVAERRAAYAKVIRRALEVAFPSEAVASAISVIGGSELPTFFNNNPSFKLGKSRAGHYVALNPAAFAGLSNPAAAKLDLKAVERLYKLTPRYEEAKVLLDAGFKSAREVALRGRLRFGAELGAALGGAHIADDIYDKAVAISEHALALSLKFGAAYNQTSVYVLSDPTRRASQAAPDFATYEELFGSTDACACAHCASVYGPAAYLVDLLRFLDRYYSTVTKSGSTKWTAKEVLLGSAPGSTPALAGRRPDIGRIDLTCENADTPLPYVDLVNEILVHAFVGETNAQNEAAPAFPEHIATVGTAEELAAMPNPPSGEEDWHETAYERLAETDFPFSLPYHHRHHEARVYLEHLGVPLHAFLSELRASWSSPDSMYPEDAAAHRLGLSPRERDLIRGTPISGVSLASAWGVTWFPGALLNVAEFLKRSGLSYDELRDLLETSVLHRFGSPTIEPAGSCKIEQQTIVLSGDLSELSLLHRFLRLRLRLGWSIRELDEVLAACTPSGTDLVNGRALRVIAVIQALRAERGISLPIAVLASWFGPLDTQRRDAGETPSLYEQLFQNRAVTNPVDAALALPGVASLSTATLLDDHTPAVLAGLRISREELSLLTEDSGLGLPPLVPADTSDLAPVTLAKLHRIVTFARALRLSLPDFHMLYNLSNHKPFEADSPPEHTLRFLDMVGRVRRSGLLPADLEVVFRRTSSPRARIAVTDEAVSPVLDQMFGSLLALRGKNGAPDSEAEAALIEDTLGAALKLNARSTHLLIADILTTGEPGDAPLGSAFSLPASPPPSLDTVSRAAQLAAYRHLARAAAVVQQLGLSADEIERMFVLDVSQGATVALDLDALPRAEIDGTGSPLFEAWEKLVDFVELRSELVGPNPSLASLFVGGTPAQAATALAEATGWPAAGVERLLLAHGYGPSNPLDPSNAAEQVSVLGLLRRAIVVLKRLGISAEQAFDWESSIQSNGAGPAESIIRAAKAKYSDAEWARVAPPLRDVLRERLRSTLVAYLVAKRGYEDSDDLFAKLLVDVETSPAVITSRLKQAIGSVQTFVQRAFLNLEADDLTLPEEAAREWAWRKSYRVWEASRKVLLQPETYLDPSLRDDKSPFFKDLEAELRQKDITDDAAERAFERYLDRLDEVANLEIVSAFHQKEEGDDTHLPIDVLHVVGRTAAQPYKYFYRTRVDGLSWAPWEPIELDIESDNLLLVVEDRRPHLFWAIIEERAEPEQRVPDDTREAGDEASTRLYIRLAWSERRNGAWGARRMSSGPEVSIPSAMHPAYLSLMLEREDDDSPLWIAVRWAPALAYRVGHFTRSGCGELEGTNYFITDVDSPNAPSFMPARPSSAELRRQLVISNAWAAGLTVPITLDDHPLRLRLFGSATPFRAFIPREVTGDTTDSAAAGAPFFFYKDARSTFFAELVLTEHTEWHDASKIQPGITPFNDVDKDDAVLGRTGLSATLPPWVRKAPEETSIAHVYQDAKRYRFTSFYHPSVCLFRKELQRAGVDGLLKWSLHPTQPLQLSSRELFEETYDPDPANVLTPYPKEDVDFSFQGAYSLYNWELFFHAPFLIALRLMQSGRHAEAQRWFHFIFDPTTGDPAPSPERFWNVRPFRENKDLASIEDEVRDLSPSQQSSIARLLASLLTNQEDEREKLDLAAQIEAWRKDPFNPHIVARMRPIAYQKAVVMKYVENLIAWGDQLFRRETIESINEATQLYVLAGNLLGRRPARIERQDAVTPRSYWQLEALGLGDLSDPVIASRSRVEAESLVGDPLAAMLHRTFSGRATDLGELYFCVPRDEALSGLWDTVADRLFKIRHSMSIEGVVRTLPLFEPPIDPMLLVQARALGVELATVLNEASSPRLPYRFQVLHAKAMELSGAVAGLGAALLAAMEKKDGEAIARLRSGHEVELLAAVREIKAQQVKEAQATVASLERSHEAARLRRDHYASLPRISAAEQGALAMGVAGMELGLVAQGIALVASSVEAIPPTTFGAAGSFGSPVAITSVGGLASGAPIEAASQALSMAAGALREGASIASTLAGYERRAEEWALQERLAAKEMQGLEKQIVAAKIRAAVAEVELRNHDRQTEQAREVLEFLQGRKRTTEELYDWMVAELSTVHYQAYTLAYDMARRAERALRFELGTGDDTHAMVRFGAWDSLKQGLLAGERLQHDLRRLEVAFLEQTPREVELVKHVSLAEVAPEQLMQLRETGACDVELKEELLDLDYPGHHFRRIKSVAVTVPTVTGPYAGVSCTLTLSGTKVRTNQPVTAASYADAGNFRTDLVPLTAVIATSGGVNDAGMFEPNLRDERYLPFEGAGVLGTYGIELPAANNRFDIGAVSDVILHIRYTARSDGAIANAAKAYYDEQPPVRRRLFSLRSELPAEWARFMASSDSSAEQELSIPLTREMFPYAPANRKIALTKVTFYARWNGEVAYTSALALDIGVAPPGAASNVVALPGYPDNSARNTGKSESMSPPGEPWDLGTWTLTASSDEVGQIASALRTTTTPTPPTTIHRLNHTLQDIYLLCEYSLLSAQPS